MKINHMICPNCGHDFYTDAAYGTCDACQCLFYASQSKTSNRPAVTTVTVTPHIEFIPADGEQVRRSLERSITQNAEVWQRLADG